MADRASVVCADAVSFLAAQPAASFDALISDPIYPEINRPYGRISEAAWHTLMRAVVGQARRILRPRGSAVFILQPNAENIGRMRPWLWEFMAWTAREWNMPQDVWWWNPSFAPTVQCWRENGLMRPSVKACVWLGAPHCYRNQDEVLWAPSKAMAAKSREDRALKKHPSGQSVRIGRICQVVDERGGTTPFNLLPIANTNNSDSAGAEGHGAGTPLELAAWWTRYICPRGGAIIDPFAGTGTMGVAAVEYGATFAGCDNVPEYVEIANRRIHAASQQGVLALG